MARLDFADFNGLPMETVKNNIKKVILAKPLTIDDSAGNVSANITGFLEAGNNDIIRLVTMDSDGNSFTLSSENLVKKMFPNPLTVSNLTVTDNTKLGDDPAEDAVTISATVIGLNCNANFSGGTVTATHFVGGDFSGTTVSASIGDFNILKVGGQPYQPFFITSTFASNFDPYRLWIDTNNANVPIIKYCTDAANASISTNWVALGAVFG